MKDTVERISVRLKALGHSLADLENRFKAKLEDALFDFSGVGEVQAFLKRASKNEILDRRVEYIDFEKNQGGNPVTYWLKECCFCLAKFETDNRRRKYCYASGHRQRYYLRKKRAELYLAVAEILQQDSLL